MATWILEDASWLARCFWTFRGHPAWRRIRPVREGIALTVGRKPTQLACFQALGHNHPVARALKGAPTGRPRPDRWSHDANEAESIRAQSMALPARNSSRRLLENGRGDLIVRSERSISGNRAPLCVSLHFSTSGKFREREPATRWSGRWRGISLFLL